MTITRGFVFILLPIAVLAWAQAADAQAAVVVYPTLQESVSSKAFEVSVDETPVPVVAYKDIHYAHFAFDGQVEVKVVASEPFSEWSLSPKRYRIPVEVQEREIRLSLACPRKLVLEANSLGRLFIFADPLEVDPPTEKDRGVTNVLDSEIDNTGGALETERLQKAIDAIPKDGVLLVPPGVYRTAGLTLKSDMTLYLAGGALIQGTSNPEEYGKNETDSDASPKRLLLIDGAENVTVEGRGVLDANGALLRAQGHSGRVLLARNSRNIRVEGIILRDPPSWNTHLLGCENVTLQNLKLLNDLEVLNTDGFDPDASRHVLIEDCFAYCGDDAVAVKCTGNGDFFRDVEDIVVRRNVFLTKKSALKVGTESRTPRMGDISFESNDVLFCDRGMTLYCRDGATYENIRFVDNRFEGFFRNNRQRLLDFEIVERDGKGKIRNVLIQDCRADVHWPQKSTIRGLDDEHRVEGVTFENFEVDGKMCRNPDEADLDVQSHAVDVFFSDGEKR